MDLAPPAGKVGNDRENTSPAVDTRHFNEGTHYRLYEKLEAHPITAGRAKGTYFAVWASNAMYVSVVGNFNAWTPASHPLQARGRSGIWEGFAADIDEGAVYKYHIISHYQDYRVDKAEPYDFAHVMPPHTASIVTDLWYVWGGQAARCRQEICAFDSAHDPWRDRVGDVRAAAVYLRPSRLCNPVDHLVSL